MPTALRSTKLLSPKEESSDEDKPAPRKSSASKKRARTKRKREIGAKLDAEAAHEKETVSRVHERYAKRKRRRSDDDDGDIDNNAGPVLRDGRVHNPRNFENVVSYAVEKFVQRPTRPEGYCLPSPWTCCLCQKGPGADMLGDLFGPYFMNIQTPRNAWPPFITKSAVNTDQLKQNKQLYTELWFHGECLFWTPKLCIVGIKLHNEVSALSAAWNQTCATCNVIGASIRCATDGCDSSMYHYACARDAKHLRFNADIMSCCCERHK